MGCTGISIHLLGIVRGFEDGARAGWVEDGESGWGEVG
jgi:hypothetical protein